MTDDIFSNLGANLGITTFNTWDTILEAIRDKCGSTLEFKDEVIIDKLTRQILPFFSKYKPKSEYIIVHKEDIVSYEPKLKYKLNKPFINQVLSVHMPSNLGFIHNNYLELSGYSGSSLEDILISENYTQMFKTILPTNSWKFHSPNELEVALTNTQTHEVTRNNLNYPSILVELGVVHTDITTIDPQQFNIFKNLCVGYMMMAIGTLRNEVNGVNTPMGSIQTNGQEIKADGERIWQESKQSLDELPHTDPIHFF